MSRNVNDRGFNPDDYQTAARLGGLKPSGSAAGSAVLCASAGCRKAPHAARWLFMYPFMEWFPMCDRARDSLMNPPREFAPGARESDFTILPLNVKNQAREPSVPNTTQTP